MAESKSATDEIARMRRSIEPARDQLERACKSGDVSTVDPQVLVTLARDIGSNDVEARFEAKSMLSRLGPNAATPAVLNVLFGFLKGEDADVIRMTCEVLGEFRHVAATQSILSCLTGLLSGGDEVRWTAAAYALSRLGMAAATPDILFLLLRHFRPGDLRMVNAAETLARIGPAASRPRVLDEMVKALLDTDARFREAAAYVLTKFGPKAARPDIKAALVKCFGVSKSKDRDQSASAICAIYGMNYFLAIIDKTVKDSGRTSKKPDQRGRLREVDSGSELDKSRIMFRQAIEEIGAERERQAAQIQSALSSYLRLWDQEERRLTRDVKGRTAEEIAQAKKQLVDEVNKALGCLNLDIYYLGKPSNLIVAVNDDHRRGVFWLKPKGSGRPVAHKANLSDLFDFNAGEPQLGIEAPRREALAEWREREQARDRLRTQPRNKK